MRVERLPSFGSTVRGMVRSTNQNPDILPRPPQLDWLISVCWLGGWAPETLEVGLLACLLIITQEEIINQSGLLVVAQPTIRSRDVVDLAPFCALVRNGCTHKLRKVLGTRCACIRPALSRVVVQLTSSLDDIGEAGGFDADGPLLASDVYRPRGTPCRRWLMQVRLLSPETTVALLAWRAAFPLLRDCICHWQ
jgi:hypothetical protein